jgi:phosphatidate cytidylyltransferase
MAALFGLPVLFALLWLNWFLRMRGSTDDLILLLIVLIMAGVCGWEASHVVRHRFPQAASWHGLYAALLIPFLVHAVRPAFDGMPPVPPVGSLALLFDSLGATAMLMLLFLGVWADIEQRGREGALENLYAVGAGLYLGVTTSFLLLLGEMPAHEVAVVLVFVAVFALDTFAYFGGKSVGGALMAPTISPKKTWSGAIIGLVGACLLCLVFTKLPAAPHAARLGDLVPWWGFLLIGVAVGIVGQMGDLLESAFKRWGQVKDSGMVLPGHGGLLDRFDSLFLAAPVCYLILLYFM